MEAIITIVGFLGAGKTTLLRRLISDYSLHQWSPFVILNDYENANLDAQQLTTDIDPSSIKAMSGSCICCSAILELRDFVNRIPERNKGITLIEANGTSDAIELMGFLGVGIDDRFMPPVQVSVIDVKNWQLRGKHNELEASQVQVSSLMILTHLDEVSKERLTEVKSSLRTLNSSAEIITMSEVNVENLPQLQPSKNNPNKIIHQKAHWASSSCDLPRLPDPHTIKDICDAIPISILRVKGVTQLANEEHFTYFERIPSGEVNLKIYNGTPTTGTKLLTIGQGSSPTLLKEIVTEALLKAKLRIHKRSLSTGHKNTSN